MTGHPKEMELLGAIMEANARSAAFSANAVIDAYETRALTSEVQLELIRERIEDLLSGPYAPTDRALLVALWPSSNQVDRLVATRRREVKE